MAKNKVWQKLFRRKDPEDRVAAANRAIELTVDRAEKTFLRAARAIRKEETARANLSLKFPAMTKVDAVVAKMDRQIRGLRTSAMTGPCSPDTARERLDELERELTKLAEMRDQEVAHAMEWERRAMMAVAADNDALALESLSRKREHEQLHRVMSAEHDSGVQVVALLREMLESLEPLAV